MKYKNILVTGGAGFIGSNLCLYLKEKYHDCHLIALDNLKRRGSEFNVSRLKDKNIEFIHGDIRSEEDLRLNNDVDAIIECSAEPSVLAGFGDNPQYIINTNLTGSINCFELARKKNADVIFLSTSRVYPFEPLNNLSFIESSTRFEFKGNYEKGISEDFPVNAPSTLYGATKLCSEVILREYASQYGINYLINRCGVITGPWQFGKIDQGVFTFWMLAHMNNSSLSYIGYEGTGKQVRDLLHVQDLCELIDLQLSNMDKINGEVFNVGGGKDISLSLLETTELCWKITGNKINVSKCLDSREGDVRIYYTDNSKVNKYYGWRPKRLSEEIMKDIYEFLKDNMNVFMHK
jgi:CDP-paratose 2-epimerase